MKELRGKPTEGELEQWTTASLGNLLLAQKCWSGAQLYILTSPPGDSDAQRKGPGIGAGSGGKDRRRRRRVVEMRKEGPRAVRAQGALRSQ